MLAKPRWIPSGDRVWWRRGPRMGSRLVREWKRYRGRQIEQIIAGWTISSPCNFDFRISGLAAILYIYVDIISIPVRWRCHRLLMMRFHGIIPRCSLPPLLLLLTLRDAVYTLFMEHRRGIWRTSHRPEMTGRKPKHPRWCCCCCCAPHLIPLNPG